jgi:O-antigen/teichoic acid export membrane protein
MHVYRKILKGTSFLSASEVASQGCSLVRNIILARFLAKADFGVAALLGMVLTLFELSGKLALSQQVIQSKQGDEPGFVASVQFTQFAAGTISALLILVAAWPLAHFFSGPRYLTSIMALALIPFISGLNNLDVFRYARRMSFGRMVLTDLVPQVLITLAAWPLAVFFGDYRAILVLLLGKAFLSAAMTHLLAEWRYSIRFDARWLRESFKFGWPLLLNGFIQIGNFQGDSMVVAAAFPLAQLGVYSVALTIAMAPGLTITRISSSLGLPLLAEVQNDLPRFICRYSQLVQTMALIGCLATLGMLLCGEQVVVLLFGTKYAGIGALACWLTAAQSLRIVRVATGTAAMARGDTINSLLSSSWRLSGLLLAIGVGLLKASIIWFAAAALVGECVALGATIMRLQSIHSISPQITVIPTAMGLACVLFAWAIKFLFSIGSYSFLNFLLLPILVILSVGAFLFCFRELRSAAASVLLHFKLRMGCPSPAGSQTLIRQVSALTGKMKE